MKGQEIYTFEVVEDMINAFPTVNSDWICECFKKYRQVRTQGCIFHYDNEKDIIRDPQFVEDFGYPQPKSEMVPFEAVAGSVLVCPNDPLYEQVKSWYDLRDAAEAETNPNIRDAARNALKVLAASDFETEGYFTARNNKIYEHQNHDKENLLNGKDGGNYSANGSSAHYKDALVEYIDAVECQDGTVIAYITCQKHAHKYRKRAGLKSGVPIEKDIIKAQWYESCAVYLKEKIELFNSGVDSESQDTDFHDKYGNRSYVPMGTHIGSLLAPELDFYRDAYAYQGSAAKFYAKKSLGEIVDKIQA